MGLIVRASAAFMSCTHLRNLEVLGRGFLEDSLMGEATLRRLDVLLLAHFEVLSEVLITAPPVKVNHTQALVSAHLMEVRVPHVVFNPVGRVPTVTDC